MSIAVLLQHADTLITTPRDVAKLRQLILAQAVQGKLVPQEVGDVPAEIISKKAITNLQDFSKMLPQIMSDHLPMNWTLTYLGNIAEWGSGSTPSRGMNQYYGGDVVWLKSGELNDSQHVLNSEEHITETALNECSFRKNKPGDVLIAMYGATIGKVAILATNAVTNQAVLGCTPHSCVYNRFLFYYLLSQKQNFMNMSEGGAQPNISKIKVQSYPIPLPPLAEQHRIVARVDELMGLCDQLEAQLQERQHRQRVVVAAALARVSADPTPANVATLFTPGLGVSPADLRQLILALAVQGKLVPQEAGDEPAGVLLGDIATCLNGDRSSNYPSKNSRVATGIPFINAGHLVNGFIDYTEMDYITEQKFVSLSGGKVQEGDLLYCLRGSLGKCAIVKTGEYGAIASSLMIIRPKLVIVPEYLYIYLVSYQGRLSITQYDNGSAQPNLSAANVKKYPIPLPPLAEQRRIVARVDALMALVDQLEAQQAQASVLGAQVLDAVVGQ